MVRFVGGDSDHGHMKLGWIASWCYIAEDQMQEEKMQFARLDDSPMFRQQVLVQFFVPIYVLLTLSFFFRESILT